MHFMASKVWRQTAAGIFLAAVLAHCTPSNPDVEKKKAQAATPEFRFSSAPAVQQLREPGDWCYETLSDAVVINAETKDYNRRYFFVGNGVYKILLRKNDRVASFFVNQNAGRPLELFTSSQFPFCLSSQKHFVIEGNQVHYDNGQDIRFIMETQTVENARRITLVFPPDAGYGLTVHRCPTCK